ncbi:MAG: tetratricopeptide repeat protein [Bradymonadales bacterium]|nr:MAG: tetratricopeptide repeat protein [Bradymonadales bacterium]
MKAVKKAPSEYQGQIQIGKDFIRAGEYKKAEKIFLEILKEHKLADVYNHLGLTYAESGDFKAAEFSFQKALKINPNYMEAALNLSVLYNNLGFQKKSKEIYAKLKAYGKAGRGAMDPLLMSKIANLYAEIGNLYSGVGEYKAAVGAYESAVDLCPDYLDVQTKLATSLRELGKKDKALEVFRKLKRKASNYAPFWVSLGVTHYALNQPKEAKKAWSKALKIEPSNPSAKAYLKLV